MQPQEQEVKMENKTNENTQQAQNPPQTQQEEAPPIKTEENQANWRNFREQREKERKERIEAERKAQEKQQEAEALRKTLEALVNKPSTNSVDNSNLQYEETEQQRIDRLVEESLEKRRREEDKKRQQREQEELPQRLSSTYSDFNQTCNEENLDYLQFHYPEVAAPFKNLPDNFETWSQIYKAVKRFVPNTDSRKDQAKIEKNLQKPTSGSVPGGSQDGHGTPSQRQIEERRAANWARMQEATGKKGIG